MDGIWNAGIYRESTQQAELSKHRLLRINLSTTGLLQPADASSYGGLSPLDAAANVLGTGPHFILSSVTPDNSHCYGFEMCLSVQGIDSTTPAVAPYTVTPWVLIGTSQYADGLSAPIWAAMAASTIGNNEMWHSFDVNASAIRFQIVDATVDQTATRSVIIVLSEL